MDATMRPDQLIDSREGDPFAAWEGVSFFPFFGMMITMTILDPSVVLFSDDHYWMLEEWNIPSIGDVSTNTM